jgi:putative two-component system response regulator
MSGVLVIDDDAALRSWARRVLVAQGYSCVDVANAVEAREALLESAFELALLDVNMPGESGIELLAHLRVDHPMVAVVMVTGEDDLGLATTAIELGAYGYLVKPVRAGELLINVTNALHRRRREGEMRRRFDRLQDGGEQAVADLREALQETGLAADVAEAFESDTMRRLVRLAEFRDDETGHHMQRMGRYCELIALELGLPEEQCSRLRLASELHDVGKVGIPDRILLKPGKLTVAEFELMKTHTEMGHRLLADSRAELMRTAATVALTHHERSDGTGYPCGLSGDDIPLAGRIAAVADVFDALTSDRVYRPAFPVGLAVDMMEAERGRHFEPTVLDAMRARFPHIDEVRRSYGGD